MNKSTEWPSLTLNWPWAVAVVVSLLAIIAWGQSFDWQLSAINAYQFFPVLGLLAFSLMWSHYLVGFVRRAFGLTDSFTDYFRYTGYVVLACLALHPGILIYQRFRDGYGLPPSSYETYVAPGMAWLTLLGSVSLLIFLGFELHRLFAKRPWWQWVVAAGDLAMIAVFYHGLRLGSQLQGGWFRVVWLTYGLTLGLMIVYKYAVRLRRSRQPSSNT